MSGIATFVRGDAVFLLVDTAAVDDDGRIVDFVPKSHVLPRLNAVMALRGGLAFCNFLMGVLMCDWPFRRAATFDDLREIVREKLRHLPAYFQAQHPEGAGMMYCELYIAGISESDGPTVYRVASETTGDGEAWEPITLPAVYATIPMPGGDADLFREYPDGLSIECDWDPVADGKRLFEILRRNKMVAPFWSQPVFGVGGQIVLNKVTAKEIAARVIHRWPDKIGETITP